MICLTPAAYDEIEQALGGQCGAAIIRSQVWRQTPQEKPAVDREAPPVHPWVSTLAFGAGVLSGVLVCLAAGWAFGQAAQ